MSVTLNLTNNGKTVSLKLHNGRKGDAFKYEDFTPEQLALLKGPKGEDFTYEDFTEEQLALLKGEPGSGASVTAESINTALGFTPAATTNLNKIVRLGLQPKSTDIFGGYNSLPIDVGYPERVIVEWDKLLYKYPSRVTKEILGKDSSGIYDIYKYEFTPDVYETTIIVNCGIHGTEREGMRGWLRTMQLIYDESESYPQLKYLRDKVRIITIPLMNPWGLANNSRENSLGIDLNRDFTEASITAEVVYLKNIINEHIGSALFIDIHNTEVRQDSNQYYLAFPRDSKYDGNFASNIIGELSPVDSPILIFDRVKNFMTINYAGNREYNSFALEWVPGAFSTAYESQDITYLCELFANIVLQGSLKNNLSFDVSSPKTFFISGVLSSQSFSTGDIWTEIVPLRLVISPEYNGLFDLNASINFTASGITPLVFLAVTAEQVGNELYDPNIAGSQSLIFQRTNTEVYKMNEGETTRHHLSLIYSGMFFTKGTAVGDLILKFWVKNNNGSVGLNRERITLKLTPCSPQNNFIHINETSAGVLSEIFPNNQY